MDLRDSMDQGNRPIGSTRRRTRCRPLFWLVVSVLVMLIIGASAVPASADVRFFVGGTFGFPVYPYPYAYAAPYPCASPHPYAYSYPYAPSPPYVSFGVTLPSGWVRGRWVWRHDRIGRRSRAWVPSHLR